MDGGLYAGTPTLNDLDPFAAEVILGKKRMGDERGPIPDVEQVIDIACGVERNTGRTLSYGSSADCADDRRLWSGPRFDRSLGTTRFGGSQRSSIRSVKQTSPVVHGVGCERKGCSWTLRPAC